MTDWQQPLATSLAGAAAIAAVVFAAARDRHPLTMVERLTTIAHDVRDENVRRLLEDERDEQAVRWALERRAPRDSEIHTLGVILFCLGLSALLGWLAIALVKPWTPLGWIFYGAGLAIVIVSRFVLSVRSTGRKSWIQQERQWRHLPFFDEPKHVFKPSRTGHGDQRHQRLVPGKQRPAERDDSETGPTDHF